MTWAPVHTFQIACGALGAFVDVTSSVFVDQGGITRSYGRQSPFNDFTGGTFAFTLDNRDGRFTPDGVNVGATPLSEGQYVTWQTDTRLVSGRIAVGGGLQLIFPDPGQPNTARIRVTVGDMIVQAARNTIQSGLASGLVYASSRLYDFWPLSDAAGAFQAAELSGTNGPFLAPTMGAARYTFGNTAVPAVGETQLSIDTVGVPKELAARVQFPLVSPMYQGVWMTFSTPVSGAYLSFKVGTTTYTVTSNAFGQLILTDGTSTVVGPQILAGVPMYVALRESYSPSGANYAGAGTLFVNGVSAGSTGLTVWGTIVGLRLSTATIVAIGLSTTSDSAQFSHLAYGGQLIHEELAGITTEANRLAAIAAVSSDIALGTLPTDLSTATVGPADLAGKSVTDALNDVMRTEQGQMFTVTTGTGTAPVQTINFRARNRPLTPTATWVAANEVRPDATFSRDLSNTVSTVNGLGSGVTALATDPQGLLQFKVGSANTSFSVLNNVASDVYTAASDRLNRGRIIGFDVTPFRIDGISGTNTDRSADLLALTLGDRHQIAGLPATQFGGNTTWDGWLIGVDENWTKVTADFTLYFERVGLPTGVYDTGTGDGNRYMADGDLSVAASINASVTSMTVQSGSGVNFLATTGTPYYIQVDAEIIQVTACTSATPQVLTVVRGQLASTPASHSGGALVEMEMNATYAY